MIRRRFIQAISAAGAALGLGGAATVASVKEAPDKTSPDIKSTITYNGIEIEVFKGSYSQVTTSLNNGFGYKAEIHIYGQVLPRDRTLLQVRNALLEPCKKLKTHGFSPNLEAENWFPVEVTIQETIASTKKFWFVQFGAKRFEAIG